MTPWEKSIIGCWIVCAVYWTISARSVKAVAEPQPWSSILAHRIPTLVGGLLLFWPKPPSPLSIQLIPSGSEAGWTGTAICVLGVLGAVWSRNTLGRNWSSTVLFKKDHELIQAGPYRFVRHPIYTSLLLMCLGSAIARARVSSFLGLLFLLIGFWIKLRQEELLLTRHFPDTYPAYRARVKALIPFLL